MSTVPDFSKRPSDPQHDADAVRETRRRLRELDGRLDLWWCSKKGRWKVMEWLRIQGTWSFTFYWQGPEGEYRSPAPAEPMLQKLAEIDWSDLGQNLTLTHARLDGLSDGRRRRFERRQAEAEKLKESYRDSAMKIADDILPGQDPRHGAPRERFRKFEGARQAHREALKEVMEG